MTDQRATRAVILDEFCFQMLHGIILLCSGKVFCQLIKTVSLSLSRSRSRSRTHTRVHCDGPFASRWCWENWAGREWDSRGDSAGTAGHSQALAGGNSSCGVFRGWQPPQIANDPSQRMRVWVGGRSIFRRNECRAAIRVLEPLWGPSLSQNHRWCTKSRGRHYGLCLRVVRCHRKSLSRKVTWPDCKVYRAGIFISFVH